MARYKIMKETVSTRLTARELSEGLKGDSLDGSMLNRSLRMPVQMIVLVEEAARAADKPLSLFMRDCILDSLLRAEAGTP